MAKEIKVSIKTIPHPNPQRAINLISNLVIKNYSEEIEQLHEKETPINNGYCAK